MGKESDLQESFFNCPELTRGERDYLIQKAQKSARTLVESARSSNGPVMWQEAGTYKGVQMYKGEARNASAPGMKDEVHGGMNYACGAVSVNATLEEVAEFFDVSTTQKMKDFAATQDDILDGVVLYTLVAPKPANQNMHQITVKWFLGNMPSRLIKLRDFLTLECQDVFTDKSGRRGWVRSYHSVKLPCAPDLQDKLGYVRGAMYHSGYVFVESERPGWLDCIFSLQVNLKGNVWLPSALYWISMKSRIKSIAGLSRAFSERRLGKQSFLSDLELVPKHQRKRCNLCTVRFSVFVRRSRCRKCGEVVCHSCSELWNISVAKTGAKQVRVCVKCAQVTDKQALENMSLVSESMDNSSMSGASDQLDDSNVADFRRESMYTHKPFRPHASQEGDSLKPLDVPASLFDAPRNGPRSGPSSSPGYGAQSASPSSPGYGPRSGPSSNAGSENRDDHRNQQRRGPTPPPPTRGGAPQRYEGEDQRRRAAPGWGHEFDPRDRRYDPKFADFSGPDDRQYDPRDRRHQDPRDRGYDRGYDEYRRQYDPRDRQYDPRDRQYDPRDRQYDPRDRQLDPRDRQFDPRLGGRQYDPRGDRNHRPHDPRGDPRQYDPRGGDPRQRGYDPRDCPPQRPMDDRNGRMNSTFATDVTSQLTDFSDDYPPRLAEYHQQQGRPQARPPSHPNQRPIEPTRSRSNSRHHSQQDPRAPPPRYPVIQPGPYRGPPSSHDAPPPPRRSERPGFMKDEETATAWAQHSGFENQLDYADLEYELTNSQPVVVRPDNYYNDDHREPRHRRGSVQPPQTQPPSRDDVLTASAIAAAAIKLHAGRQLQTPTPPPPAPPKPTIDADDFDENRTMTFNSPDDPPEYFTSDLLYSVTSSSFDEISTLNDYSAREIEFEPESEDRGSLSVDDAIQSSKEIPESNQPVAVPETPSVGVDKSLTVVQIYEQILLVTKKQHALDANPKSDTVAKAALDNELASLYKQLNDLNLTK